MALLAVEFRGKIADMGDIDFLRINRCCSEAVRYRFLEHIDNIIPLFHPVASKIGLMPTKHVYGCRHNTPPYRRDVFFVPEITRVVLSCS